ncbi:hypothetical protein CR513_03644, partial [Mucuna pruriens]
MDWNMIDATSGGALMDKTLATTRHLISNMANNMHQFGTRGVVTSRVMNEVGTIDNLRLENQLTELISLPTVPETAVPTESGSRVVYSLEIRIFPKHVGSELE